jgi:uncharacterized protein YceK
MRTVIAITLALLVFILAGCATTEAQRIAKQYDEHVYGVWTSMQGVEFVTRNCPRTWNDDAKQWVNTVPCVEVPGTRDAHDIEFWKFQMYRVAQVRIMYGAVPVGPRYKSGETDRIGVVGNRDQCERVRAPIVKPKGVAGNDGESWTEPCEGPFYFRRLSEATK